MKALIAAALIAIATPAIAQDRPACYMQTASGTIINLNSLCGFGPQSQRIQVAQSASTSTQGKTLSTGEIGQVVLTYAQNYCDNRSEGMSQRRASAAASKAAIDWAFTLARGVPANRDFVIQEMVRLSPAAIAQECPEFAIKTPAN